MEYGDLDMFAVYNNPEPFIESYLSGAAHGTWPNLGCHLTLTGDRFTLCPSDGEFAPGTWFIYGFPYTVAAQYYMLVSVADVSGTSDSGADAGSHCCMQQCLRCQILQPPTGVRSMQPSFRITRVYRCVSRAFFILLIMQLAQHSAYVGKYDGNCTVRGATASRLSPARGR